MWIGVLAGVGWLLFDYYFPESKLEKIKRLHHELKQIENQTVDDDPRVRDAVQREIDREARPVRKELERLTKQQ